MPTTAAIQDLIPAHRCWGCGTLNPGGLHLKSYLEGDESVCRFQPWPEHMAGPPDVFYGGMLAAVVDCHSICTAIADLYRSAGRAVGEGAPIWAVTASLKVDYLAPTPIAQPMELRARIREASGRKRVIACTIHSGGRETARAEVLAIQVAGGWGASGPASRTA